MTIADARPINDHMGETKTVKRPVHVLAKK